MIDEESHENILIYDISHKTLIGSKPLQIRFDKIDGIIRNCDGTRDLPLFGTKKYDIYDRIRYLMSLKSDITYIFFSHYFVKIKVHSYDSLSIEKTLTLHNVTILNTML